MKILLLGATGGICSIVTNIAYNISENSFSVAFMGGFISCCLSIIIAAIYEK